VSIDAARSPDRDDSFVFEHLVHYCSKFEPLPAIGIEIEGRTARVVRGHEYLLAATALGRSAIRAVVTGAPKSEKVKAFVAEVGARFLDWEAIKAAEQRQPVPMGWHVVFFRRPLSPAEKAAFDMVVTGLFDDSVRVDHHDAGPVAEFEAPTPVTDEAWATKYLGALSGFKGGRWRGRRAWGSSRRRESRKVRYERAFNELRELRGRHGRDVEREPSIGAAGTRHEHGRA